MTESTLTAGSLCHFTSRKSNKESSKHEIGVPELMTAVFGGQKISRMTSTPNNRPLSSFPHVAEHNSPSITYPRTAKLIIWLSAAT